VSCKTISANAAKVYSSIEVSPKRLKPMQEYTL